MRDGHTCTFRLRKNRSTDVVIRSIDSHTRFVFSLNSLGMLFLEMIRTSFAFSLSPMRSVDLEVGESHNTFRN